MIHHCQAGDDKQNDTAKNKEDCDGIHDTSGLGQRHVDVLANVCNVTKHSYDHINGVQGDATCAGTNDEESDAVHI